MLKLLLAIITSTFFLLSVAYADGTKSNDNSSAIVSTTQVNGMTLLTVQCPAPNQLQYDVDTKLWSAPNDFKSYSTSFVEQIKSFHGAQWNGAGLGQIFCIYYGADEISFPVMLAYNIMVIEPHQNKDLKWTENLKGYRNCLSYHPSSCVFQVRAKPKDESLDNQIKNLQSEPSLNTPTF